MRLTSYQDYTVLYIYSKISKTNNKFQSYEGILTKKCMKCVPQRFGNLHTKRFQQVVDALAVFSF